MSVMTTTSNIKEKIMYDEKDENQFQTLDHLNDDNVTTWGEKVYENERYIEYENGILLIKCSMNYMPKKNNQ